MRIDFQKLSTVRTVRDEQTGQPSACVLLDKPKNILRGAKITASRGENYGSSKGCD